MGFDGAGYAIVPAVCSSDECHALISALDGIDAGDRLGGVRLRLSDGPERLRRIARLRLARVDRMVAIRLHLDDCATINGPLRVIPGSHTAGRLSSAAIAEWRDRGPEVVCTASPGEALVMRPLLLHASSPAMVPAHRRVLHVEYACESLPHGLEWFEQCA
jgi:hypothetical protein